MKTLYCLKCKSPRRWYVGQTPIDRFSTRLDEHKYYRGAKWTSKHGVDSVVWTRPVSDDEADEAEDEEAQRELERGLRDGHSNLFIYMRDLERKKHVFPSPF